MAHATRLPADEIIRMIIVGLMLVVMGVSSTLTSKISSSGSSSSSVKENRTASAAAESLKYWKSALGEAVELPETLAGKLSPLTSSQLQHYSRLMQEGKVLASNGAGASLCKDAGLVCASGSESRLVSPECGGGHQSYARVEVDEATFNRMAEDPELNDFFRESAILVKKGSTLRLPNLRVQKLEPSRKFLPRQLARPFELNNLEKTAQAQEALVAAFPMGPRSSPLMVHVMDCVSPRCGAPPMLGERKACVSSLEELADFAAATLFGKEEGEEQRGHVAWVPPQDESGSLETARLLLDAQLIARPGTPILTCHDNMYPFQMYYCHAIRNTKLYKLTFQLRDSGKVVEKVATCHMDTSQWPARHPAFAVLHSHPGDGEACHYIVKDDILFYLPHPTTTTTATATP